MVDIIDNQLNSGWIAKTNSVSNPSSMYKSGQGQVIWLKPEAQMTDVQRMQAPDIPPGQFQLEAEFEKDIMEIAGVNSELFGMAENDKIETAGILSKMRQSAGLINLQDLFDGLRESQKLLGQKVLKLIQLNYTPEKIKLITKKDATPEFFSKTFQKYDVVVEEGILTDTQRESQFAQLMGLKTLGVQIPDSLIIKNSNLHGKKDLEEILAAQAKAQQDQLDQQAQLQMQNQATVTHAVDAKAESDRALAAERLNKVGLDAALNMERMTRAEEERTAGALNIIKAIKELGSIDLEHLERKLAIIRELEGKNDKPPSSAAKPAA